MSKLTTIKGAWPYLFAVFLNAFVDLGHKIVIQNSIFKAYHGETQVILTAIVNALILLPFILLLTPAGFISDRYPKNSIIRASAWAAVFITLAIVVCYYQGLFWPAFAMTLLLAIQSAFYSPAKFAYIKPLFGKEKLTQANGLVQAVSIIAILSGTLVYSLLFESLYQTEANTPQAILQSVAPLAWLLVVNSLIELIMAYKLPTLEKNIKKQEFDWSAYRSGGYLKQSTHPFFTRKVIRLAIIGLTMFWSIGQLLLANFPAYAKSHFAIDNTLVVQATLATTGIGIALGSWIAGRNSKHHIELGLIPVGALGVAAALMFLPALSSSVSQAFCFFTIGLMGGMFIVPLNSLIQFHAQSGEMGKILALNNWVQHIGMASFLMIAVAFSLFGFDSQFLLYFTSVIAIVGGLYTIYKLPQSLLHILVNWTLSRHYKIDIQGIKNIPEQGGTLLLGNHISWIDWAILQIACPRQVRFVMERSIFNTWYLKWLFKALACVPIDNSASSKSSINKIAKMLDQGEVVALFPEGAISRNGHLGEFKRGFELICKKASLPVAIIPFYIRGLWGSKFSHSSKTLRAQRSQGMFRDVIVAFAKPMPQQSVAQQVKQQVFDLSVASWNTHTQRSADISRHWIDTVKRRGNKSGVTDNMDIRLSSKQLLVGAICLAKQLKQQTQTQNIGLLLPTSSAGVLMNIATLLAGKTIVNLNYTASLQALTTAQQQADIKHIVTSKRFLNKLQKRGIDLTALLSSVRVIYVEEMLKQVSKIDKLRHLLTINLLPAFVLKAIYAPKVDAQQVAAILFSSGSEGQPKGVMLSHANILANIKQVADVLNTQSSDVILGSLPLFHAFGLTITQFLPLIEGVPLVCYPDPTDAVGLGKTVLKNRATIMCATSTFLRLYSKNRKLEPLMFDSLRIVVAGAEKLNPQVKADFEGKFKKDILEGYGTTETTPVASVNMPNHKHPSAQHIQVGGKTGTVGMPLPGTNFKIVDPNSFEPLATGEAGMVLIGGAQVMLGYLNDVAKTQQVIKEIDGQRWYVSGDKGKLDKDGFLTIVDRYSRFAKLGGEMISLGEVEQSIINHHQADIELVAINLPDAKKGESISLLYQGDLDINLLKKKMLDKGVNPLMLPKHWLQVQNIPKLGSGKTDYKQAKLLATQLQQLEV